MPTHKLDKTPAARTGTCPNCKAPTAVSFRPFCSKRCADVDLGRWLGGRYAIAGIDGDQAEEGTRTADVEAGDEDDEN